MFESNSSLVLIRGTDTFMNKDEILKKCVQRSKIMLMVLACVCVSE